MDFFFINLDERIEDLEPTESSVGFGDDTEYFDSANQPQGQVILLTLPGETEEVLFDSGPVTLEEGSNFSLYVLPSIDGNPPLDGFIVRDGD